MEKRRDNFKMLNTNFKFINFQGFTLIELIVVIAIISLLAVFTMPLITTQIRQSKIESTKQEMLNLKKALLSYYEDVYNQETGPIPERGHIFPRDTDDAETDLAALEFKNMVYPDNSDIRDRWDGPYIEASAGRYGYAKDAWGNEYDYDYDMGDDYCSLKSAGSNESFGDSDDISITIIGKMVIRRKNEKVKKELEVIKKAAQQYYDDNGVYPNYIDDLVDNGYVQEAYREDEWGNEYEEMPGAGNQMFISKGPDGEQNPSWDNIQPY